MSEEQKKPYWDGRAWVDPRPPVVEPAITPDVELDFLEEKAQGYEADAEEVLKSRGGIDQQLRSIRAQQQALEQRAGELAAQSADKLAAAEKLKARAATARGQRDRLRAVLDKLSEAQQELVKVQQDAGVALRERPKEPAPPAEGAPAPTPAPDGAGAPPGPSRGPGSGPSGRRGGRGGLR